MAKGMKLSFGWSTPVALLIDQYLSFCDCCSIQRLCTHLFFYPDTQCKYLTAPSKGPCSCCSMTLSNQEIKLDGRATSKLHNRGRICWNSFRTTSSRHMASKMTSMRCDDVASTLGRHHFNAMCLLGSY